MKDLLPGVLAVKSVRQNFTPSEDVLGLLGTFMRIVNTCNLGANAILGVSLSLAWASAHTANSLLYRLGRWT